MSPIFIAVILFPVFALLAVLFGNNARRGLRTGAIYAQGARYERSADPVFFWIAFGFSVTFAAACIAAMGFLAWALASFT